MISSNAFRLLNLGPTAWARTQSVYRATAELFPADSYGAVIFGQPLHPYVTHGVQQFASETFDLAACERLGLPVIRRPFPGGAEYCDVNQLLFQWVLPPAVGAMHATFLRVATGVLSALQEFGVEADYDGAGQFTVRGARIGTLAGGRYEAALVCLGCVYLEYDAVRLAQVERAPRPEKATSLWAEASRPLSPEMMQDALIAQFAQTFGRPIERDTPRVPETRRAKQIEMELLGVNLEDLPPEEAEGFFA
jgi:lipoate-protein ligase A